MTTDLSAQLKAIIGTRPESIRPLHGGMIGEVYLAELVDKTKLVVKQARGSKAALDIEGYMLRYLREHSPLPVPEVLHTAPELLVMTYIDGGHHFDTRTQRHAAELLAILHTIRGEHFGLERDTLIGSLHQPNSPTASWIDFFRDHRLLYMGRVAAESGQLPQKLWSRIEKFASDLARWLDEPDYPSLIHGDVWTTNVLAAHGKITGFIDPAVYYAHPEIELAFITLFSTFGEAFFAHYHSLNPIQPGFMQTRRHIYNLYPLLVHVQLFGGGYVYSVDSTLQRFGY